MNVNKDNFVFTTSGNIVHDLTQKLNISDFKPIGNDTEIQLNGGNNWYSDPTFTFGTGSKELTINSVNIGLSTGSLKNTQAITFRKTTPSTTTDKLYVNESNQLVYNGSTLAQASGIHNSVGNINSIQYANGAGGFGSNNDYFINSSALNALNITVNGSADDSLYFQFNGEIKNPRAIFLDGQVPSIVTNKVYRQDNNLIFDGKQILYGDQNELLQNQRIPFYDSASQQYTATNNLKTNGTDLLMVGQILGGYAIQFTDITQPADKTRKIYATSDSQLEYDTKSVMCGHKLSLQNDKRIPYWDNASGQFVASGSILSTDQGISVGSQITLGGAVPSNVNNALYSDSGNLYWNGALNYSNQIRNDVMLTGSFNSCFAGNSTVSYASFCSNQSNTAKNCILISQNFYIKSWNLCYISDAGAFNCGVGDSAHFNIGFFTNRPSTAGTFNVLGTNGGIWTNAITGTYPSQSFTENTLLSSGTFFCCQLQEFGALTPASASVVVNVILSNRG